MYGYEPWLTRILKGGQALRFKLGYLKSMRPGVFCKQPIFLPCSKAFQGLSPPRFVMRGCVLRLGIRNCVRALRPDALMCLQIGQGSGMQALKLLFDLPDFFRMLLLEIRFLVRQHGGKEKETKAEKEKSVEKITALLHPITFLRWRKMQRDLE